MIPSIFTVNGWLDGALCYLSARKWLHYWVDLYISVWLTLLFISGSCVAAEVLPDSAALCIVNHSRCVIDHGSALSSWFIRGPGIIEGASDLLFACRYGEEYVPSQKRQFTSRVKNAQEAHEAIRPTDINCLPCNHFPWSSSPFLFLHIYCWSFVCTNCSCTINCVEDAQGACTDLSCP
jgi:hypothetical protein